MSNNITTQPNASGWEFEAEIFRTSATTAKCIARGTVGNAPQSTTYTGIGETLANALTIKITGQNDVASANDIIAHILSVTFIN